MDCCNTNIEFSIVMLKQVLRSPWPLNVIQGWFFSFRRSTYWEEGTVDNIPIVHQTYALFITERIYITIPTDTTCWTSLGIVSPYNAIFSLPAVWKLLTSDKVINQVIYCNWSFWLLFSSLNNIFNELTVI